MGRFTAIDGNILEGVSATTLWTLRNRAVEATRSDGVIRDPWAVTVFDGIEYDYGKFGRPGQAHALRARAFDSATRDHLARHRGASVVALAEGLQTSFWRLDRDGALAETRWYSVDLPPVTELRAQLLPDDGRIVTLAQSALDLSWMDRVHADAGSAGSRAVFITAEGLLMYLPPDEALGLIRDCARRFPGGAMMFDAIPHWFSARTLRGMKLSDRYVAPPMPFAMTADEGAALAGRIPGVASAREVPLPPGRGLFARAASPRLDRGLVRRTRPSIILLEFADDEETTDDPSR
ncbi:O-methyltransferase involved in polyketide biosynthesis [Mycolicibacterium iranicum]|uniref:O-methyltransferase involved in polyketide biosynthesis n=1 Tax=Mycolicibacterium iranicum TaxID=912594 RepID=A0A839QF59_MYCIR|nr:class I SAM-dependent methyltransferase [Mycolicibacterium iranicum]MBB2993135.1 O-methyltransferase involved in polyketide biosynthesis [Mycolicibacterium iranicum]